jgi:feruloyl esterase
MGLGVEEMDEFYRFFRIGGMGHCRGGEGAGVIGQGAGGSREVGSNVLMRVVEWVEKGEEGAPEWVGGVKFVNVSRISGPSLLTLWFLRFGCCVLT